MANVVQLVLTTTTNPFLRGLNQARLGLRGFTRGLGTAFSDAEGTAFTLGKTVGLLVNPFTIAAGGVLAFGKAMKDSVAAAADFQQELANVSTLVDTTVVDMKEMKRGILELSSEVNRMPVDLVKGMYQTISAGAKPGKEAFDILSVGAKFASAGLTDTYTAVDALTSVINAYGLSSKEATRVADVMFKTVEKGKITAEGLAQNIGKVIPFAAQLKIPIEQVGAFVATLTKGGLSAELATTAAKNTFTAFVKGTDAFRASGVEILDVISKRGLAGGLEELKRLTDGNIEAIREYIPDQRALTGVLSVAGDRFNEYKDILKATENAQGANEKAFKKNISTMKGGLQGLKIEFNKLGTAIGDIFIGPIEVAIRSATRVVRSFNDIIDAFKKLKDETKTKESLLAFQKFLDVNKDLQKKSLKEQLEAYAKFLNGVEIANRRSTREYREEKNKEKKIVTDALDLINKGNIEAQKGIDSQRIALVKLLETKRLNREETLRITDAEIEANKKASEAASSLRKIIFDSNKEVFDEKISQIKEEQKQKKQQLSLELADFEFNINSIIDESKRKNESTKQLESRLQKELSNLKDTEVEKAVLISKELTRIREERNTIAINEDKEFYDQVTKLREEHIQKEIEDRKKLFENIAESSIKIKESLFNQQDAFLSASQDLTNTFLDSTKMAMQNWQTNVLELASNTISTFKSQFSNTFSDIVLGTKTAGEAFKEFGNTMIRVVTDFVGQWIASKLTMMAFSAIAQKLQEKAALASGATVAAAWAQAASFVSLATFGANALPAAAAITSTTALANALAVKGIGGQAGEGVTSMPHHGTILVNKGERIVKTDQNKDLTDFLSKNQNSGNISIDKLQININNDEGLSKMSVEQLSKWAKRKLVPALDKLGKQGVTSGMAYKSKN